MDDGDCGSVPVKSKVTRPACLDMVQAIFHGPVPLPSSSIQSSKLTGLSGIADSNRDEMVLRLRSRSSWIASKYNLSPNLV